MNNLGNMCHSQIALFADDINMYVTNADVALVQAHINSDLALLSHWATTNGFRINIYLSVNPWFWLKTLKESSGLHLIF